MCDNRWMAFAGPWQEEICRVYKNKNMAVVSILKCKKFVKQLFTLISSINLLLNWAKFMKNLSKLIKAQNFINIKLSISSSVVDCLWHSFKTKCKYQISSESEYNSILTKLNSPWKKNNYSINYVFENLFYCYK